MNGSAPLSRVAGLLVGLLFSGMLLAACGADRQPTPSTSPPESLPSTSAPEPLPSATPTPTEAESSSWGVDFDGVGAFRVDALVVDMASAVVPPYTVEPAGCPNPATTILRSDSHPTVWLQDRAGTGRVDVVAVGGDVPGDPREAQSPHTESGVGIGSSLDQVQAAYPDGLLETTLQGEPDRVVVAGVGSSGAPRYLVFSFFENDVQTILVQASSEKIEEFCG